jgi:L-iditol 2-dehydrogenase
LRSTNFDPGGFAEYIRVPEINVRYGVFVLPDGMSFEDGTFVEPLGCVARGQRFAGVSAGQTVLVIGSGISGLMHIQLARLKGAARIIATDISDFRLEAARRFGADVVIRAQDDVPRLVREANQGRWADTVIVCTAAQSAFEQAFQSVDCAGTLLLFAPTAPGVRVPLPLYDIYFKSAKIIFSYAAADQDIKEAIDLLHSKKFNAKDMMTHTYGLADIQKGFDHVARAEDSIKVVIFPNR